VRGKRDGGGRALLILSRRSAAALISSRGIDDGRSATEQLAERRKTTGRLDGLGPVGLRQRRERERLGPDSVQERKESFFFIQSFFYFAFQTKLLF
jgi:hypothetical protein